MNIKAKFGSLDVTIIAIIEGRPDAVKVVYVDENGKINYIYIVVVLCSKLLTKITYQGYKIMKWHFEKFKGDMAIYAICPKCGFSKNVSYVTANTEICIDPRQIYNYCPNCGEKDTSDHYAENVDVIWNKRNAEERWKEN